MSEFVNSSSEMAFFSRLIRCGSFVAAATKMGVSTPAVSRRLALLEGRLGVKLLTRTTRRMSLTIEGEQYLIEARRILSDIEEVEFQLTQALVIPHGVLRVNATLGFGRSCVAPVISNFCKAFDQVQVQLHLSATPPSFDENSFDVCIRFGEPQEAKIVAHKVADNRRLLCASPAYLERHGVPKTPHDLVHHHCIEIRHGEDAFGPWRFTAGQRTESVVVHGGLRTNDEDIAVSWGLDGHGILKCTEWDIGKHIKSGQLLQLLKNYQTPSADIYALYPQAPQIASRVSAFVNFFCASFVDHTI